MFVARAIGPAETGHVGPGGLRGFVEKDTKSGRVRTISIDATTVDVLETHRTAIAARALAAGAALDDGAYVFSEMPDGSRPWSPKAVAKMFRRLCDQLGIDSSVRPYGTRHFAATQLLAAGVDPVTVAGRLGHARKSTTLDIYAHALRASDQAAGDIIGEVLHRRRT